MMLRVRLKSDFSVLLSTVEGVFSYAGPSPKVRTAPQAWLAFPTALPLLPPVLQGTLVSFLAEKAVWTTEAIRRRGSL